MMGKYASFAPFKRAGLTTPSASWYTVVRASVAKHMEVVSAQAIEACRTLLNMTPPLNENWF
jgi:hypothetical protein